MQKRNSRLVGMGFFFAALLLPPTAKADLFLMNFTPLQDFLLTDPEIPLPVPNQFTMQLTGSFTTDGLCDICQISQIEGLTAVSDGILTAAILDGHVARLDFDESLPIFLQPLGQFGTATFNRSTGAFSIFGRDVGNSISAQTNGITGSYSTLAGSTIREEGLFSITAAVPEPGSLILLGSALFLICRVRRKNRKSPTA